MQSRKDLIKITKTLSSELGYYYQHSIFNRLSNEGLLEHIAILKGLLNEMES